MKLRNGASMIELVIAIVIIGIAMMTLPMMLTRVQSNNEFAMQQEAILMARTQLGDILTYPWDEKSTDSSLNVGVLDTQGDSHFNRNPDNNSTRRIGHVKADKRRKFFTNEVNASVANTFGQPDGGAIFPDDIDDFDTNTSVKVLTNSTDTNATLGYKVSDSNMTISIKYLDDTTTYNTTNGIATIDINTSAATPIGTTNIKMIEVSLKNSLLDGNMTLRAFSSNIGANQLLRRTF